MSNGFFEDVLPDAEGWVPILSKSDVGTLNNFRWFNWPHEKVEMVEYIETLAGEDVYFSPMLFQQPPNRTSATWARKANVTRCVVVTCDGDGMDIDRLRVRPTTVVQSSKNHWQGYWRFVDSDDDHLSAHDFEDMSRGLYNAHADDGMDSGWPLAVKRRVPYTTNTKPQYGLPFKVQYVTDMGAQTTAAEFAAEYPPAEPVALSELGIVPDADTNHAVSILASIGSTTINDLFIETPAPGSDWSSRLYRLECLLFEHGKGVEDVYVVASESACNKYARDGRPDSDLWVQVNRDYARWSASLTDSVEIDASGLSIPEDDIDLPDIDDATPDGLYWSRHSFLSDDEYEQVPDNTFIDVFVTWAQSRSKQSPWEFNVAGACVLLSGTLARYASLPLSFGNMPLNLYFMVLGRTTQSRKSTSLRLARELLSDMRARRARAHPEGADEGEGHEDEYWIPDDSTPEALTDFLNGRPRRSSIYAVDEWQDTLAAAARKGSYTSGLIPFLTKAYDGKIPGVLRKTSVNRYQKGVEHYMSFYGTGIFEQTANALTVERIESGFVPRCLMVVDQREGFTPGAGDVEFLDGERSKRSDSIRKIMSSKLHEAVEFWQKKFEERERYCEPHEDPRYSMECEPEAFDRWKRYAYEITLLAANHPQNAKALFPVCERMSFSVLKVAGLLALVERHKTIKMRHILKAIAIADTWARCAEALVVEVCNNGFASEVREVEQFVASQPGAQVRYEHLLTRFQSRFEDPRRLRMVLDFCNQKGTLRDILANPTTKERIVQYVR